MGTRRERSAGGGGLRRWGWSLAAVFALATGQWAGEVNLTQIGALAADVMARAIVRAATEATGLPNIPAARDLKKQ